MTECVQTIPLDEIIPGALIRFTVIDGVQYMSIRDLIMFVCDASVDYAGQIWRNIPNARKSEVHDYLSNFQFPGRGQVDQPVITFPGAIKLSMFLPGEKAKQNRASMTNIIVRYFAGDKTLIEEIAANALLDHPIAQMARGSLKDEQFCQPADPEEIRLKMKREELMLMHDEVDFYSSIITHDVLDEHGKGVFKEKILSLHAKELMEIQRQKRKEDIQHALAMLDVENERRAAELDHAKMLLDIATQKQQLDKEEVKIESQPITARDVSNVNKCDIISAKDYVSSLLRGQMKPWMIQDNYTALLYRLKKHNPSIPIIRHDNRIFFHSDDLPAIKTILFQKLDPKES